MAGYIPEVYSTVGGGNPVKVILTNAARIRYNFQLYGGPSTLAFDVPNADAASFQVGDRIEIGPFWVGEVLSKTYSDEYRKSISCAGYARRMDTTFWRGRYNVRRTTDPTKFEFKTAEPPLYTTPITDMGRYYKALQGSWPGGYLGVLEDIRNELGRANVYFPDNFTLTVGLVPYEAEMEGNVRDVLTQVAQIAGKAWTILPPSQSFAYPQLSFQTITKPYVGNPSEETLENVRNVVVIEGTPKPPIDKDVRTDQEIWDYFTDINDFTGGIFSDGDARFYSDRKIFVYKDAASVAKYGVREERLQVPFIDGGGTNSGDAYTVASRFFALYSTPMATTNTTDVIKTPDPANPALREKMPWDVCASMVNVEVLKTGSIRVTYQISLGALLDSNMFKKSIIKVIPGKAGIDDTTPPSVTMSLLSDDENARIPEPVGSPLHVFSEAIDTGTGVGRVEVALTGTLNGTPASHTYNLVKHPWWVPGPLPGGKELPVNKWVSEVSLPLDADGNPTGAGIPLNILFTKGTRVEIVVKAVDNNGNPGYSSAKSYMVDKDPPKVTVGYETVQKDDTTEEFTSVASHYYLRLNISDKSKVQRIVVYRDGAVFKSYGLQGRPDDIAYIPADNVWQTTQVSCSTSNVKHRYRVEVTDVFGNVGVPETEFRVAEKRNTGGQNGTPGKTTGDQVDRWKKANGEDVETDKIHGSNLQLNSVSTDKITGRFDDIRTTDGTSEALIAPADFSFRDLGTNTLWSFRKGTLVHTHNSEKSFVTSRDGSVWFGEPEGETRQFPMMFLDAAYWGLEGYNLSGQRAFRIGFADGVTDLTSQVRDASSWYFRHKLCKQPISPGESNHWGWGIFDEMFPESQLFFAPYTGANSGELPYAGGPVLRIGRANSSVYGTLLLFGETSNSSTEWTILVKNSDATNRWGIRPNGKAEGITNTDAAKLAGKAIPAFPVALKALTYNPASAALEWGDAGGQGGGQVDRIQDPTDPTTYCIVDDATGELRYFSFDVLITKVDPTANGGMTLYRGSPAVKRLFLGRTGIIEAYNASGTKTWGIDNTGIATGVKIGFKAG